MKKLIVLSAVAIMATFSLTSCDKKEKTTEETTTETAVDTAATTEVETSAEDVDSVKTTTTTTVETDTVKK
jgi:uncharacterized lipoprotein YehR (DUF1307 family)